MRVDFMGIIPALNGYPTRSRAKLVQFRDGIKPVPHPCRETRIFEGIKVSHAARVRTVADTLYAQVAIRLLDTGTARVSIPHRGCWVLARMYHFLCNALH